MRALAVLLLCCVAATSDARLFQKRTKQVTARWIYTAPDKIDGKKFVCWPCELLKGTLKARGVKIQEGSVFDPKYRIVEFPTVVYSDGTTDSGQLVHDKRFKNPASVTFYKVQDR